MGPVGVRVSHQQNPSLSLASKTNRLTRRFLRSSLLNTWRVLIASYEPPYKHDAYDNNIIIFRRAPQTPVKTLLPHYRRKPQLLELLSLWPEPLRGRFVSVLRHGWWAWRLLLALLTLRRHGQLNVWWNGRLRRRRRLWLHVWWDGRNGRHVWRGHGTARHDGRGSQ